MGTFPRLDPDDETAARQEDDNQLHGLPRLYGTAPDVETCRTHGPYPAILGDGDCPLCVITEHATRPWSRRRWRD